MGRGGKRKRGTYNSTARKWKRGGGESVSCFYLGYPDRKTKEAKKPFRRTNEKAVHARDPPPLSPGQQKLSGERRKTVHTKEPPSPKGPPQEEIHRGEGERESKSRRVGA